MRGFNNQLSLRSSASKPATLVRRQTHFSLLLAIPREIPANACGCRIAIKRP
jgi:hypothetical protein